MDGARSGQTTRRQLFEAMLAAPAAAALPAIFQPSEAAASGSGDVDLLRAALGIEQLAVVCYDRVLATNTLGPEAARFARQFRGHEQAHVRAVSAILRKLGGAATQSPSGVDAADKQLAALGASSKLDHLRSEKDSLKLLIELEQFLQGGYYVALTRLSPSLAGTAAQILSTEGQHCTVLSNLLRPGNLGVSVPYAFVEGRY